MLQQITLLFALQTSSKDDLHDLFDSCTFHELDSEFGHYYPFLLDIRPLLIRAAFEVISFVIDLLKKSYNLFTYVNSRLDVLISGIKIMASFNSHETDHPNRQCFI